MPRLLTLILSLSAALSLFAEQPKAWSSQNRLKLGVEYNSNLFEFYGDKVSATCARTQWDGEVYTEKRRLSYFLSFLQPLHDTSESASEEPSDMIYGSLDYTQTFSLSRDFNLHTRGFLNVRDVKTKKERYFVEEDPFNLFGVEVSGRMKRRSLVTIKYHDLDAEENTKFNHRMIAFSFERVFYRRPMTEAVFSLSYSHYDFEDRILILPPPSGPGTPPPHPRYVDHSDKAFLLTIGMRHISPLIVNWRIFYRDYDSNIADYDHWDVGVDAALSYMLTRTFSLSLFLRYEDRHLSKEYILFEPQILTGTGNRFFSLSLTRAISDHGSLELKVGRYSNDIREDFFPSSRPRYLFSLNTTFEF